MIIKSNKHTVIVGLLLSFSCIIIPVLFYLKRPNVYGSTILFVSLSIIVLRHWITVGRTIVIHTGGITVKFLCFKKEYSWDDFELRHYTNYENCLALRSPSYRYGAEFSTRGRGFRFLKAHDYGFIFRPFSLIFVYFDNDLLSKIKLNCPVYYLVNGDEFKRLMEEWGIKIEDGNEG